MWGEHFSVSIAQKSNYFVLSTVIGEGGDHKTCALIDNYYCHETDNMLGEFLGLGFKVLPTLYLKNQTIIIIPSVNYY